MTGARARGSASVDGRGARAEGSASVDWPVSVTDNAAMNRLASHTREIKQQGLGPFLTRVHDYYFGANYEAKHGAAPRHASVAEVYNALTPVCSGQGHL